MENYFYCSPVGRRDYLPCPRDGVHLVGEAKQNRLHRLSWVKCAWLEAEQCGAIGGSSFRRNKKLRPAIFLVWLLCSYSRSSDQLYDHIFTRVGIIARNADGLVQAENVTKQWKVPVLCSTDYVSWRGPMAVEVARPNPCDTVEKGGVRRKNKNWRLFG